MLRAVATRKPLPTLSRDRAVLLKEKARLLEIIKAKSLLTGGPFKLASGGTTDYYLDLKPTTFDPEGAALTAEIVYSLLRDEPDVDAIGGFGVGGGPANPSGGGLSLRGRPRPGLVVRNEEE